MAQTENNGTETPPDVAPETTETKQNNDKGTIPRTWPANFFGSFDIYKYSKRAVMQNVGIIFLLYFITFLSGIIFSELLKNVLLDNIVSIVIGSITGPMLVITVLKGIRREKIGISSAFNQALPFFLNYLVLTILVYLAYAVSLLLLIIPFFFVLPRTFLASYYLVDKNLGPLDAFKASWNDTKGHVGKIYGIIAAFIVVGLLFLTIVGIPFVLYFYLMYSAAPAILYTYLQGKRPEDNTSSQSL